ncbi:HET-domain-containing protein [Nemania sp. FL0031]|nr:HET-domain-containing protein [Nemania sp. FL0031]
MASLESSSSGTSNTNKTSANSIASSSKLSSCGFCSKVLSAASTSGDIEVALGAFSDAVNADCPHSKWLRVLNFKSDWRRMGCVCEWGDLLLSKWNPYVDESLSYPYMALERPCSCDGTAPSTPTHAYANFKFCCKIYDIPLDRKYRVVNTEYMNMDYIKTWLDRCRCCHGGDCDKSVVEGVRTSQPDLLIDIVNGCLSPNRLGETQRRYLALSYVWGQPGRAAKFEAKKDNIEDLKRPGALLSGPIALKLAKTIRNAIHLTKLLGETFLWVDSLCIVQDDNAAREKALRQMHSIYSGAVLTIIVESGRHAEDGIRGIRELTDPPNDLGGDEVIGIRLSPPMGIFTHPQDYHMRMWTFQEYFFSKRRLIFGDGPVMWECNNARWRDDVVSEPRDRLPENNWRGTDTESDNYNVDILNRMYNLDKDGIKSRLPKTSNLNSVIALFNSRVLTKPTDVLYSFSGIQTMLEEQMFPDGLLYGLPEFYFDIALLWVPGKYSRLVRRRPGSDFGGDPLFDKLPSWSWMGWQGGVQFLHDIEFEATADNHKFGFTSPITKWFTAESPELQPGRSIRSQWRKFRRSGRGPLPEDLLPEGWSKEIFSHTSRRDNHYNIGILPKCLPKYLYSHASEPGCYWYPVPVQGSSRTEGEIHEASPQTQYLYCKTRRAFLYQVPTRDTKGGSTKVMIRTCRGRAVGILWYDAWTQKRQKLELVSIVRGYSLSRIWSANPRRWYIPSYTNPEDKDFHDEDCDSEECDGSDEGDESGENEKVDCYFVLSIYWEGGVAYRRAAGLVEAHTWERHQEAHPIDLILG